MRFVFVNINIEHTQVKLIIVDLVDLVYSVDSAKALPRIMPSSALAVSYAVRFSHHRRLVYNNNKVSM